MTCGRACEVPTHRYTFGIAAPGQVRMQGVGARVVPTAKEPDRNSGARRGIGFFAAHRGKQGCPRVLLGPNRCISCCVVIPKNGRAVLAGLGNPQTTPKVVLEAGGQPRVRIRAADHAELERITAEF